MEQATRTEEIRDYFRRLFLGKVRVHSLSTPGSASAVEIRTGKRTIAVYKGASAARVVSVSLVGTRSILCSSKTLQMRSLSRDAKGVAIVPHPAEVRGCVLGELASGIRNGMRLMRVLPQERMNRSSYVARRPLSGKRIFLAFYSPVIYEAILKTALNRQKGTLLIWYNLESRAQTPYGTYLMKKIGGGGGFEWEWSRADGPNGV